MSEATRRRLASAAAAVLALLLLRSASADEILRRVRVLSASASKDLAVRRLAGSSAAFDRNFFVFAESARRRLPPGCAGVALYTSGPGEQSLYLASYVLAPTRVRLNPASVPSGWIAAIYGRERPPGWEILAELPGGALATSARRPAERRR